MEMFQEARKLHEQGKYAEAEKLYDMLLSQNWNNAGLLATMGTLFLQTRRYGLAISFLQRALERNMNQSDVLSNLSLAYKNSGQGEKARHFIERACKLPDPGAETLANYAGFHTNAGKPDKALEIVERAIAKNPELAIAHWNKSLALLEKGEWATAWDEHEWGLKRVGNTNIMRVDREIGAMPVWDGSPGKIVAIYGEQGIGDEIMFASMIPDVLRENTVILECHKRLKTLFEKTFGITCYGTREDTQISWPSDHTIDARISIGSLGKFYRRSADAFPGTPYLKATPCLPPTNKLRVGISWTGGGPKQARVQTRTVPLSWWRSILGNDCEFVSLQYTDCEAEIELMEKQGFKIAQYPQIKADDYYETAQIVASCDLVISVCTSVIHLAGALGVPCWVMVPSKPAWRYGISGRMPWYRSVRLYRQNDSWMAVVERIAADLSELLDVKQEKVA